MKPDVSKLFKNRTLVIDRGRVVNNIPFKDGWVYAEVVCANCGLIWPNDIFEREEINWICRCGWTFLGSWEEHKSDVWVTVSIDVANSLETDDNEDGVLLDELDRLLEDLPDPILQTGAEDFGFKFTHRKFSYAPKRGVEVWMSPKRAENW